MEIGLFNNIAMCGVVINPMELTLSLADAMTDICRGAGYSATNRLYVIVDPFCSLWFYSYFNYSEI
jgi:hypothetical protein